MPFVDASFNELVSSSILSPHSQVILHEGFTRSCRIHISKSEEKPSPWGEGTLGGSGVRGKCSSQALTHHL